MDLVLEGLVQVGCRGVFMDLVLDVVVEVGDRCLCSD